MTSLIHNEPSPATVPECAEGWMACQPERPCPRHVKYWEEISNKIAQPPQREDYPTPVLVHAGNSVQTPSPVEKLEAIFTYHDDPAKIPNYVAIRKAALLLARTIVNHTPQCADQTAAIRKVREAVMTANAAIALDGMV